LELLGGSPIAEWCALVARRFNSAVGSWQLAGHNSEDHTTAVLGGNGSPLVCRCWIHTGWRVRGGQPVPATLVQLQAGFSLLELNAERLPDERRHTTDLEPAPAALSLEELAEAMNAMLEAPALAVRAADLLLGVTSVDVDFGLQVASSSGASPARTVDLRRFDRLPAAVSTSEGRVEVVASTPPTPPARAEAIRAALRDLLLPAGYRPLSAGLAEVVAPFR
jgi:hypothetical protein